MIFQRADGWLGTMLANLNIGAVCFPSFPEQVSDFLVEFDCRATDLSGNVFRGKKTCWLNGAAFNIVLIQMENMAPPKTYSRNCEHMSLTPAQRYERGMDLGGFRQHRRVPYNENFIAMTLPTTTKGVARVQQSSGVKINGIYYWSDEMRKPGFFGRDIPKHPQTNRSAANLLGSFGLWNNDFITL